MVLPSVNPTTTSAWKRLDQIADERSFQLQEMFREDPGRAEHMHIAWEDFYLDYSKNLLDQEVIDLLIQLAEEVDLARAIEQQFSGELINETEGRAVWHTALRNISQLPPEVKATLSQIKRFTDAVINGDWKGYTGKSITHVVNIGIGGSDLGPDMVVESLRYYRNHLDVRFVSNVDGDHVMETIKDLDRETTLFIIVSKTFTTQETLTNARTIRQWFLSQASEQDIAKHFVAVSTNLDAVSDFGIAPENTFPMWDWVGGRFSLWSAVGLSIACGVGFDNFHQLLEGAHRMDNHFKQADFRENIPVMMGLISVWYNNFYGAETEAIVPYSQYLSKLVAYLQQGIMESNGKGVDRNGEPIDYQTGTIIWGSTGTNAQHAFFQLIHQGTKLIPTDFIAFARSLHGKQDHQNKLLANCFAQTEALMEGTWGSKVENNFKEFSGNRPTNTLLIDKLTPSGLGALIACYEHKLFVQGIIWNIFSYDQWGVELGKKLAKGTLSAIEDPSLGGKNSSTQGLLERFRDKS